MEVSGSYTLNAPREHVWARLLDPSALRRITPGCELLELKAPDHFRGRVRIESPAVEGRYDGTLRITDHVPPTRLRLVGEAASERGTICGDAVFTFEERGPGTTVVTYAGEAQLSDALANVGMRMLGGIARTLLNQFFARLAEELDKDVSLEAMPTHDLQAAALTSATMAEAPQQYLSDGRTLPEAAPLAVDDSWAEAKPLDAFETSFAALSTPASAERTDFESPPVPVSDVVIRTAGTPSRLSSGRHLTRRAATATSREDGYRLVANRAAIVAGFLTGSLAALFVFLVRRNQRRLR